MKHLDKTSAIGENTADNRFDSSNIVANRDGSVLERTEYLIQSSNPLSDYILIDKDEFDVLDADSNNERWDVAYITGAAAASTNINSTTAGKLMIKYTLPAAESRYQVKKALPVMGDVWKVTVDLDLTWGTMGTTGCAAGIGLTKTTTYDATNYLYFERAKTSTTDRLTLTGKLNNVNIGAVTPITLADNAVALKIERWGEIYRFYYSTTQNPSETWVLFTELEDASNYMTNQVGIFLEAYTKAAATSETIQADFDNFQLFAGAGGGSIELAGDYDSTWTTVNKDGNVFERLEGTKSDLVAIEAVLDSDMVVLVATLSDINSDVKAIEVDTVYIEGIVSDLNSDIKAIETDTVDIQGTLSDIVSDIQAIETDTIDIQGLVSDINSNVVSIETDTVNIQGTVSDIRSGLVALRASEDSDMVVLRADIAAINIGTLGSDIILVKSDISDMRSDINELMSDLEVMISDLATAAITTIASDIVIMVSDIKGIRSDLITDIQSDIATLASDIIATTNSDIVVIISDIATLYSNIVATTNSDIVVCQSDIATLASNIVATTDSNIVVIQSDLTILTAKGIQVNTVALAAGDFTGTVTRFTVASGPILVRNLGLLVTTALSAGANTLRLSYTPTGGAATNLTGTADTDAAGVQQLFVMNGVKNAGLVKCTDAGIATSADMDNMPIILGSGIIQTIFSAGAPALGAGTFYIQWEPLNVAAAVT